jgi:hypothetical protein
MVSGAWHSSGVVSSQQSVSASSMGLRAGTTLRFLGEKDVHVIPPEDFRHLTRTCPTSESLGASRPA